MHLRESFRAGQCLPVSHPCGTRLAAYSNETHEARSRIKPRLRCRRQSEDVRNRRRGVVWCLVSVVLSAPLLGAVGSWMPNPWRVAILPPADCLATQAMPDLPVNSDPLRAAREILVRAWVTDAKGAATRKIVAGVRGAARVDVRSANADCDAIEPATAKTGVTAATERSEV